MKILKVPIGQILNWDKNPRDITKEDFERLKSQIQEFGLYKPLVCFKDNDNYITLGGNMRLKALKELNYEEIDVSVVEPKNESQKLKISLSDNDRAGYYKEPELRDLVFEYKNELNLEDYKVDLGENVSLQDLAIKLDENFGLDDIENQGQLNEKKLIKCPQCGNEFNA